MTRPNLIASLAVLGMSACLKPLPTQAATQMHDQGAKWTKLDCRGTKQTQLKDGQIDATAPNSTDEMQILRQATSLIVTINNAEMRKVMKRDGYASDIYAITNIDKDGLAAAHAYTLYPTVHTLVINSAGDQAIWTEASIAFYTRDKKPLSTTVFFACKSR